MLSSFWEILLKNIGYVTGSNEQLIGFLLPFVIAMVLLVCDRHKIKYKGLYLLLFLFTISANFLSVEYIIADGMESLTFTSFSILSLGLYVYATGEKISVHSTFYFPLFTSVITDIIAAPNDLINFLYGIGGAGHLDGLLLIPSIYAFTFIVFNSVRIHQEQDRLLLFSKNDIQLEK
jgi:hypothetical protein